MPISGSQRISIVRSYLWQRLKKVKDIDLIHEVFDGNVAEVSTLKVTLETLMQRFKIRCVIAVADRGLLSIDNLAEINALKAPSGVPLGHSVLMGL